MAFGLPAGFSAQQQDCPPIERFSFIFRCERKEPQPLLAGGLQLLKRRQLLFHEEGSLSGQYGLFNGCILL